MPSISDIDHKLAVARSYQKLLKKPSFFPKAQAHLPENAEVDAKIKEFIQQQLEQLFGGKKESAQTEPTITPEEKELLQVMVQRVAKKPSTPKAPAPTPEPAPGKAGPQPQEDQQSGQKDQEEAPIVFQTGRQRWAGQRERKYKEICAPDGKKVKLDVTGQTMNPEAKPPATYAERLMSAQASSSMPMVASNPDIEYRRPGTTSMRSGELSYVLSKTLN